MPTVSSLSWESEIRSIVPADGGESFSQLLQQGLNMTSQRTSWFNRQNSLAGASGGVRLALSLIKPRQTEPGLRIPRIRHRQPLGVLPTMFPIQTDARLQVLAGVSLLHSSRLVRWSDEDAQFEHVDHETFESTAFADLDPHFGRLIRWMLFTSGAEFLGKGLCLLHGIDLRTEQDAPAYPPTQLPDDVSRWISAMSADPWNAGKFKVTHFGQLGQLTKGKGVAPSYFERLIQETKASASDRRLLFASYRLVTMTIRNRDAHAYVPNVRDNHFWMVEEIFLPALNLLVAWIPKGGGRQLQRWRSTTGSFIRSLT
jgi:hypothetical protein